MAVPPPLGDTEAAGALALTCQELDSQPMAISEDQAARFFQVFSLQSLFSVFTSPSLQPSQEECVLSVLSKLLKTRTGAALLPHALPYLDAASHSPKVPLRRLAVQQYSALLQAVQGSRTAAVNGGETSSAVPEQGQQEALVSHLLEALQDRDTGVAHDAAFSLVTWACTHPSHLHLLFSSSAGPLGRACQELSGSCDETVRLRLLSLVSEVAGRGGPAVVAAVHSTGVLPSLLSRELSQASSDPLSALSALSTVSELADRWSRPGTSFLTDGDSSNHGQPSLAGSGGPGGSLISELCSVVVSVLPTLVTEPLLLPGALGAAALLVREAVEQAPQQGMDGHRLAVNGNGHAPMDTSADGDDGSDKLQGLSQTLLQVVGDMLDERGSASHDDEAAALEAVGKLAGSCAGAELALRDARVAERLLDRALGRTTPSATVRIAALHALAAAAGLDRAIDAGGGAGDTGTGGAPTGPLDSLAATLSAATEQLLQVGSYQAAAATTGPGAARSPCEALVSLAAQPVPELAVASYRAATALALRPWFAAELCAGSGSNNGSALLAKVIDPATPAGRETDDWRRALLLALWTTTQAVSQLPAGHPDAVHQPTLAAAAGRLKLALRAGSGFNGLAVTLHDTHLVATIP